MTQQWKSILIVILSILVIVQYLIIGQMRQENHWLIADQNGLTEFAMSNKRDAEDCAQKLERVLP